MTQKKNLPIAVSMGEPGGINIEIILNCVGKKNLPKFFLISNPVWVIKCIKELKLKNKINIIHDVNDCKKNYINILPIKNNVKFGFKKSYTENVPAILESLNTAIKLVKKRRVAGLVTLPIMKKTLLKYGFNYAGHTDYLGKVSKRKPLMIMLNKKLKVAPLTTHIPLSEVNKKITKKSLDKALNIYLKSLEFDFGISDPKIAVSSLNPHNGENGELGKEELNIIKPVIKKLEKKGLKIKGPKSADTMFHNEALKGIDGILCMYHDQALIPIKSSDFYGSINYTAGLPFVRTSPDHGTAFDIVGKKEANNQSLINAIKYAKKISDQRIKNEYQQ